MTLTELLRCWRGARASKDIFWHSSDYVVVDRLADELQPIADALAALVRRVPHDGSIFPCKTDCIRCEVERILGK
jgi:hypothetical protein